MATQITTTKVSPSSGLASYKPPINSATPSAPTSPMARPYKAFFTPSMHRHFAQASGVVLALCWAEASLMSDAGWFWSWFPISLTGLRALMLMIPCLAVFIVRVQNMHVGSRTTTSGLETIYQRCTWGEGLDTTATLLWYCFSAMLFGETYIWTRSHNASLGWIDPGRPYERPRINENPVFLRAFFLLLGLVQTGFHMATDLDQVPIHDRVQKPSPAILTERPSSKIPSFVSQLDAQKGTIVKHCLNLTLLAMILNIPFYFIIVRRPLWDCFYWAAGLFMSHLHPNNGPVGLIHFGNLVWQTFTSSLMLVLLWQGSNAVFSIFIAKPPLKKAEPLTNEIKDARGVVLSKSSDPNWSLIRGLSAKQEMPKSFAFWELSMICRDFPARRKTIFTEVDRADRPRDFGTTWSQVSKLCLSQISAISHRIKVAQQPIETQQEAEKKEQARIQQESLIAIHRQEQPGLPRIADQKVIDSQEIMQKTTSNDFLHGVGGVARSIGQSPGGINPVVPYARKAISYGADAALGKELQAHFGVNSLKQDANAYALAFLRSPLGVPLRQTFARRASAVIFGIPNSNNVNIISATQALVKLVLASLIEDDYGQVAKDVPTIVRTLTAAIGDIEKFIKGLEPHWTDVEFRGSRRVKDAEEVWTVLRDGLEQIMLAFDEYASAIGLTKKEIREAKEAVGRGAEMVQARS